MGIAANVQDWTRGQAPVLQYVEIWPTYRCNLKCQFCGAWREDPQKLRKQELSDDNLRSIVSECIELGAKHFTFSGGGEPWIRGKIVLELLETIMAAGRTGQLTTNGTLLSEEDIEKLAQIGWSNITFSIDGPSSEIHDILRGRSGALDKTLKAMRLMLKTRDGARPRVAINHVITQLNVGNIPEFMRMAAEEGVDEVLFQGLMENQPECGPLMLDKDLGALFKENAQKGVAIAEEHGISTNLASFTHDTLVDSARDTASIILEERKRDASRSNLGGIACYESWNGLAIGPDGKISTCGPLSTRSERKYPETSCREAWFGEHAEGIRKMMYAGEIHGYCRECCSNRIFENREVRQELVAIEVEH